MSLYLPFVCYPFPTYSKPAADNFENVYSKIKKKSIIVGIINKKKGENIVAKGEIACFKQFLLLSQCFQKLSPAVLSKCIYTL